MFDDLKQDQGTEGQGSAASGKPNMPSPEKPSELKQPAPVEDIFKDTEAINAKPAVLKPKSMAETPVANIANDANYVQSRISMGQKIFVIVVVAIVAILVIFAAFVLVDKYLINKSADVLPVTQVEENTDAVLEEEVIEINEEMTVIEEDQPAEDEEAPVIAYDTDQDGLTDEEEKAAGTDINLVDTDGDGLGDYEEVYIYKTDPLNRDTDDDGYLDGEEVKSGNNPKGDGKLFSLPIINSNSSEAVEEAETVEATTTEDAILILNGDQDSDGDGLTNREEDDLLTDPQSKDTDKDGLTDYEEVRIYKTNPLNADTDGDGYLDGAEVQSGYNPNGNGKL